MALRHKTLPIEGVQFHPESIMTNDGMKLIANFLKQGRSTRLTPGKARVLNLPSRHDCRGGGEAGGPKGCGRTEEGRQEGGQEGSDQSGRQGSGTKGFQEGSGQESPHQEDLRKEGRDKEGDPGISDEGHPEVLPPVSEGRSSAPATIRAQSRSVGGRLAGAVESPQVRRSDEG